MGMDFNFWLQFAIVMVCVAIGGRLGGVGLGAAGGLGVCLLVLVLGVPPGAHHHGGHRLYVRPSGFGRS